MDLKTLNKALANLEQEASNHGFFKPHASLKVRGTGEDSYLILEIFTSPNSYQSETHYDWNVDLDDILASLTRVREWLHKQPSPLALRQKQFNKNLSDLITEADDLGLPILADLEATMKRLSTNILEHSA